MAASVITDPLSADAWRARIAACKRERRQLVQEWSINVDYRRGKPFAEESDDDRIAINLDHPYTRAKVAQLYSQTPQVSVSADRDDLKPIIGAYAERLNKELLKANIGDAMVECVIDCVNASGIGAILVSYEERTEAVDVPAVDPLTAQMLTAAGQSVPTTTITRPTDRLFSTTHLSPDDLLWPLDWAGSDWDKCPWIGRSGRMFWPEAQAAFGLKDEDKETICGDAARRERLRADDTFHDASETSTVEFDEIFFRLAHFDANAKSFSHIQRLVFVHGLLDPVVDEPAKHQQIDPQTGQYLGSCRFPLQVLTLDYISDDAIPPSDSAMARPQVDETIAHRTQTILNRKRSVPMRWADVNRVDPLTLSNMQRGTWQNVVPVKGNGDAILGEIHRAAYPPDDYQGANLAMRDVQIMWGLSPNQAGAALPSGATKGEAEIIQQANDTMIGAQRQRVAKFFLNCVEVFSGLLALYGDLPFPHAQTLAREFSYTIRPESTVLKTADQRTRQLANVLNLTANSGFINPAPIIEEICALNDLDVSKVMKQPEPKVEQPNISYRFNGADLMNPLAFAMLMQAGHAPSPQELEAAKQAIAASVQPAMPQPVAAGAPAPAPAPARIGPGLDPIVKRGEGL